MTNGQPHPDDLISAHYDGELTPAERTAVEQLLEGSADARAEFEDYRALSEVLRELPGERAPEGLRSQVMRRIEQESLIATVDRAAKTPRRAGRIRLYLTAGGLATVAMLFMALLFWGPGTVVRDRQFAQDAGARMESAAPTSAMARNGALDSAELADLPAIAGTNSLELLGTDERLGDAARPPAGFSVGDVYWYLERTGDGDVMVVQASVLDVRQTLSEMQVLLNRNSIPTMPVSLDATSDEFGGVEVEGTLADSEIERNQFGLYVETNATQMNAALDELSRQSDLFVKLEFAGVLDPNSEPQITQRTQRFQESETRLKEQAQALDQADETHAGRQGGAALGAGLPAGEDLARPQSRASVPAERVPPEPAAPAGADFAIPRVRSQDPPLPGLAASDVKARESAMNSQAGGIAADPRGYQKILNLSRDNLQRQLSTATSSETKSTGDADRPTTENNYFRSQALRQRSLNYQAPKTAEPESRGAITPQNSERRLRLLFVLDSEQTATKAMKASTMPAAAPVEAPVPPRKKG